ncbi:MULTISPECIES: plasmid mobilization protein [Pseudomonas syringae group]|nr:MULTISPECIES: CopG family transcriptional regulator [Pseudomonas syringae group]KPB52103.1 TraJ protein [Pseudomonas coronafaciens pv. oryzae]KPY04587.1 TraJ protein [Pseudomonas coronafaciens pv. oryzae]MCF5467856.1 CopG family transcriptional regulator [Pseudomonas syringae]MCF5472381.1 CopG family transcriptional regulator [Pseudomonas syringae]MCF5485994.1 CopG family transcriptional regulator [Pseudomonas syringae]
MEKEQKITPRRKLPPIKVWVSEDERAEIEDKARQTNMSLSAYLLAVGRNTPVRSVVDLKAIADLVKVNGDLGRVAGLLKLWLAEKRGEGVNAIEVESVMMEFRRLQVAVGMKMGEIVKVRR